MCYSADNDAPSHFKREFSGAVDALIQKVEVADLANRALSDVPIGQRPTLRQGSTGEWVAELQRELTQLTFYDGPIDGNFGAGTLAAVKAFQSSNKLTADGVVGRNTWSALIFLYAPLANCPGSGLLPTPFKGLVIDAGHGGTDPGATSGGLIEKDMTLAISAYQNDRFYELNIPHCMTRTSDVTLNPTDRVNKIKSCFGDVKGVISISNHINAGGGEGAEVIYALRNTATYPTMILNELKLAGQVTRKVYQKALESDPTEDYYYVMRDTNNTQPIIVEYGFIDNTADATRLRYNWMRYAEAVIKATCEYIGYPYRPPYNEEIIYTVLAGDTLFNIAQKFQTTVEAIMALNNLTSSSITVGQRLKIPVLGTMPPPSETTFTYTVTAGDTLFSIANRFGTTVAELRRINNLTSDILRIGQQLQIPSTPVPGEKTFTYTVVAGDSLWAIAQRFGTTVAELRRLNNLTSDALTIGQELQVPSADGTTPPATRPTLRLGDRGKDVTDLQNLLVSFGYNIGSVDGIFGQATQNAVKAFQSARGLPADGIVGPATWNVLLNGSTPITYTVVRGDTLFSIAQRFGTTANAIIALNNLSSTSLSIGQQLLVP